MAMRMGAYENPQLYGVDFTESTKILQEGMQSATDAVNAYEKQKAEARQKLENDFAEFKELQYIDKLKGVNENINNTIKTSVGLNLGLADFSQLSPDERANLEMGAKEARAFRDGLGILIDSAQNNVYDKRVPPEYEEFIYDLANGGENLEYIPDEDGIGFKLQFTSPNGEKSEYDAAKIAMMTTQFSDVSEELETAGKNIRAAATRLQKKNVDGVGGVTDSDIETLTESVWSSMDERTRQIYFAEYVGDIGRELRPKYKLVNGKKVKLSEEEAIALGEERDKEFKDYLAREIGGQTYEVAKSTTPYRETAMDKARADVWKKSALKDLGLGEEELDKIGVDEELYNTLAAMQEQAPEATEPQDVDLSLIDAEFMKQKESKAVPALIEKYGDVFEFERTGGATGNEVKVTAKGYEDSESFDLNNWTNSGAEGEAEKMRQFMQKYLEAESGGSESFTFPDLDIVGNSYRTGSKTSENIESYEVRDGFLILYGKPIWNGQSRRYESKELARHNIKSKTFVPTLYRNIMQGNNQDNRDYRFNEGGKPNVASQNETPSGGSKESKEDLARKAQELINKYRK